MGDLLYIGVLVCRFITARYEEALKEASKSVVEQEKRIKQEEDAHNVILAEKSELHASAAGASKLEIQRLEAELQEERLATQSEKERVEKLAEKLEKAAKDAEKQVAKHLEVQLNAKKAELDGVQKVLEGTQSDLKAMTAARDAKESEVRLLQAQLAEDATASKEKLATCLSALAEAQSAARHGGYFFSAAPTSGRLVRDAVKSIGLEEELALNSPSSSPDTHYGWRRSPSSRSPSPSSSSPESIWKRATSSRSPPSAPSYIAASLAARMPGTVISPAPAAANSMRNRKERKAKSSRSVRAPRPVVV